jgi:hypothetical protein
MRIRVSRQKLRQAKAVEIVRMKRAAGQGNAVNECGS